MRAGSPDKADRPVMHPGARLFRSLPLASEIPGKRIGRYRAPKTPVPKGKPVHDPEIALPIEREAAR